VPTRLLYGSTIFSGSLLLFLIQPMMAKALLPAFGGSAGVWACALFFFQAALLAGYAYAWVLTRCLAPRAQAFVHLLLLALSLFALPAASADSNPAGDPSLRILSLLAMAVGGPYFLLAANSPLMQAWFARRVKPAFPYRLFALSNLASLAALLLYPFAIEPLLPLSQQIHWWRIAYIAFAAFAAASTVLGPLLGPAASTDASRASTTAVTVPTRLLWFALAFCPSVLWMATANTLSQSVAPIPFLWILPLAIYLLTLTLCFDRQGWYRPPVFRIALPAACLLMGWCAGDRGADVGIQVTICLFAAALFVCAMFCHGELARRKPDPQHLPSFYLTLAAGGAAGGLFVGILAPLLFEGFLELPIGVTLCVLLAIALLYGVRSMRRLVRLALFAAAGFVAAVQIDALFSQTRVRERNFYGALRVIDKGPVRILANGAIHHGAEFLDPAREHIPTTYYGRSTGVGWAIASLPEGPRRIGAIGLGTGTLASYARPGDEVRFYEINPADIALARDQFRFLADCAGTVEIVPGDGRLSLTRDATRRFDLLAVDAFSGDAIPLHLLTAEAFRLYLDRLQPSGILALHITNRYLDLAPEVLALAAHAGLDAHAVHTPPDPGDDVYDATWVIARHADRLPAVPRTRVWTDDFSNLFETLK